MNWLARLKENKNAPDSTPTKPTKATFAGSVGAYPDHFQKSVNESSGAVSRLDTANAIGPTDSHSARLALFTDRGLNMVEAEAMTERLTLRDAQQDERRLCLECMHLSGGVDSSRCSQWRKIGLVSGAAIPGELVTILQRCAGFNEHLKGRYD